MKAWADLQGLAALRRLREAIGEQVRMTDDLAGAIGRDAASAGAQSPTARRSTRWCWHTVSQWQVSRRLDLAVDADGRGRLLHAALAEGRTTLDRAGSHPRGHGWPRVDEVHAICERLLAPNADGSIRTERAFRRELRRQIAVHTPDPAADRVTKRWLSGRPTPASTRWAQAGTRGPAASP